MKRPQKFIIQRKIQLTYGERVNFTFCGKKDV